MLLLLIFLMLYYLTMLYNINQQSTQYCGINIDRKLWKIFVSLFNFFKLRNMNSILPEFTARARINGKILFN